MSPLSHTNPRSRRGSESNIFTRTASPPILESEKTILESEKEDFEESKGFKSLFGTTNSKPDETTVNSNISVPKKKISCFPFKKSFPKATNSEIDTLEFIEASREYIKVYGENMP